MRKRPPSIAELDKRAAQRRSLALGSKWIKTNARRDAQEAEELIAVGHEASQPSNMDLREEHKRRFDLAQQVDDLVPVVKRVAPAVDADGNLGVFITRTGPRSEGLWRQFIASFGRLLGRPVDTNFVDRVKTK
jgi:hypothetical protein